jgi:DNA-binding NarL/FixJ family response regulator
VKIRITPGQTHLSRVRLIRLKVETTASCGGHSGTMGAQSVNRSLARCVIADSSPVVVAGLRTVLLENGLARPVGETDRADHAVEMSRRLRPDILLSGLGPFPSTFRLAEQVDPVPVLALVWSCTRDEAASAITNGLGGVALMGAPVRHLGTAITAVLGGATPVPRVASYESPARISDLRRLTKREALVVELVAAGLTNTQIAVRLGIAPQTVKNHLHSAMGKLGAHSRVEICLWNGSRSAVGPA